ncbi:hypothetical protein AVEN_112685-1 [Araneus ventricosus]|uniref:Uncharacterized protein n=1 Tax=Araneus ventricosus TaxID=182803 RepID=A0A4Y2RQ54_ARAVE|nr:hypothetical protein AVEN_112685-1 [Araneus ventricosus]
MKKKSAVRNKISKFEGEKKLLIKIRKLKVPVFIAEKSFLTTSVQKKDRISLVKKFPHSCTNCLTALQEYRGLKDSWKRPMAKHTLKKMIRWLLYSGCRIILFKFTGRKRKESDFKWNNGAVISK